MGTKSAWTPERRARQAAIATQTRPWEKATGPRTAFGKAISSRNASNGGAEAAALAKHRQEAFRASAFRRAEQLLDQLRELEAYKSVTPLDDESPSVRQVTPIDNAVQ
jgi:hypothetical protein